MRIAWPRSRPFLRSSHGAHFSVLGYPWMSHQIPLLHCGTQRQRKDFQRLFFWCVMKCHIRDATSEAKLLLLKIIVVVVAEPSLKWYELSGPVRDTPPYRAIPFRDSWGYRTHLPCFQRVSRRYRWDTRFEGGGHRNSTSHALQGGNTQKRGRGYRTQLATLRHQKPHSAQ